MILYTSVIYQHPFVTQVSLTLDISIILYLVNPFFLCFSLFFTTYSPWESHHEYGFSVIIPGS